MNNFNFDGIEEVKEEEENEEEEFSEANFIFESNNFPLIGHSVSILLMYYVCFCRKLTIDKILSK